MTTFTIRTNGHHMVSTMLAMQTLNNSVSQAQTMLRQVHMVNNFGQVIEEHSVSAPVIATMRAVPEFEAAVTNFPDAAIYNQVPTHRSDEKYTMAMESLGEIAEGKINALMASTQSIAQSVRSVVMLAGELGQTLKSAVARDRLALESSDITDDEINLLETTAVSDEALGQMFTGLESYYDSVSTFNVDNLRANPEQLSQELDGLSSFIVDLGSTLGMTLTETGLAAAPKSSDYIPTQGYFEQKGYTKAGLLLALDRTESLIDQMITMSDRHEELGIALENEANDIPTSLTSDDVTYGAQEHITLMCCYATMVGKMIQETVVLASDLCAAIDPIASIVEAGKSEIEQVVETSDITAEEKPAVAE